MTTDEACDRAVTETASTDDHVALPDLLTAHEFRTWIASKGHFNTHCAGCVCGVEFSWSTRYEEHQQHHIEVIEEWAQARICAAVAAARRPSPFCAACPDHEACATGHPCFTDAETRAPGNPA